MTLPSWGFLLIAGGLVTLPFWLALWTMREHDRPRRGRSYFERRDT